MAEEAAKQPDLVREGLKALFQACYAADDHEHLFKDLFRDRADFNQWYQARQRDTWALVKL